MAGLVNIFENFAKAANECLYGRGERVKIEYISDNGRRLEKSDE